MQYLVFLYISCCIAEIWITFWTVYMTSWECRGWYVPPTPLTPPLSWNCWRSEGVGVCVSLTVCVGVGVCVNAAAGIQESRHRGSGSVPSCFNPPPLPLETSRNRTLAPILTLTLTSTSTLLTSALTPQKSFVLFSVLHLSSKLVYQINRTKQNKYK